MSIAFRQWVVGRPIVDGVLSPDLFDLVEGTLPPLSEGQALARIKVINIHPGTRARIVRGWTKIGETNRSNFACAEIIQSRDPAFKEGDVIACQAGWQDYQIISSEEPAIGYAPPSELVKALNGTNSQWCYAFRPALVKMWPPEVLLDMLGTTGLTAYFGLRECGPLTPRDVVAVGGASGAVGSVAAQLAKKAGCHVVGFAGGADRCEWVTRTLGIDHCIDYRAPDFDAQIKAAFPSGVDFFCDGVGGAFTESLVQLMNRNGRLFAYGSAAEFYGDATDAPAPSNLRERFGISESIERTLKDRNIKSEAWIVDEFYHERPRAEDDLSRLMRCGALKHINNLVEGFENTPQAIADLYAKGRSGKLQIRFAPV
ncbi:MAG: zinc-binding dehydrogenase [Hyphomonadaceae bacterium]